MTTPPDRITHSKKNKKYKKNISLTKKCIRIKQHKQITNWLVGKYSDNTWFK